MKKRNLLVLVMTLTLLASLFAGCGAKSADYATEEAAPMEEPMMYATKDEMAVEEEMAVEDMSTSMQSAGGSDGENQETGEAVNTYAEKIIYSGRSYMETTEFDNAVAALEQAVEQFGGFIQDSNVSGNTRRNSDGTTVVVNRWGYYTVRIPAVRFDEFMTMTEGIGNVISSGRTAENVTSKYTDYEARLESLTTQEERLLSMLQESGDLESLIALEARLSEVRYEIESIERNLRDLDQRLSYSTVNVEIQEVEIYTPTATTQRSFGEKIADAFRDSWQGFGRGAQNFAVWFVGAIPTLLVLGALVTGVVLIVRKARKADRKRCKTEEKTEE